MASRGVYCSYVTRYSEMDRGRGVDEKRMVLYSMGKIIHSFFIHRGKIITRQTSFYLYMNKSKRVDVVLM